MISQMLLVAALLLSCSEQAETKVPVVIEEPDPIGLAFSCVSSSSRADTRMTNDVVQTSAPYRAISNFRFFAFKEGTLISATVDHQENLNTYYHYSYCNMPTLTNGCLVYAKAVDVTQSADLKTKAYNGYLNAVIPDHVTSTDDIYFEPVPIYGDATVIRSEATDLADALTGVVDAVPQWTLSDNSIIKNLYSNFTNRGYAIPGSAASVKQWMLALSDAADSYLTADPRPTGIGDAEVSILTDIKTAAAAAAATITVDATSYPRIVNLPDGAAALRWTETLNAEGMKVKRFLPQLKTTTLADINSVTRFVYPPALYYFVNSPIWTSNSRVTFDDYKNRSTWKGDDDNAVQKLFKSGETILTSTKTVAVAYPLQYAVAQLSLKVRAKAATVKYAKDAEDHDLTIPINVVDNEVTTNYFRLTGVIIDGQRPVDYEFKQASNLDSDVSFVFDSQMPDDFYLTTTAFDDENTKVFNTLVLQSYDGEDVNIILEFEYTGPQAFKCLNGYVYPNTRFYLVGKLEADKFKANTGDETSRARVFTKDYITTIQAEVFSLEKAYNVLPNILSKNLEIGVMTTPKWIFATPPDPLVMD